MSELKEQQGYIAIASNIEEEFERIKQTLSGHRVVSFIREKFLIEDAKAVIAEAYISEEKTKYILLGGYEFNNVSQNALLKILEEPPHNIEFILIVASKSVLLPTILSRLPIKKGIMTHRSYSLELQLARLDYAEIFSFLKAQARISRTEALEILQALQYRATVVDKLILSATQLKNFDMAYRLLDLNARPQSVLAMILMSFVSENNHAN